MSGEKDRRTDGMMIKKSWHPTVTCGKQSLSCNDSRMMIIRKCHKAQWEYLNERRHTTAYHIRTYIQLDVKRTFIVYSKMKIGTRCMYNCPKDQMIA